jgi:hypothetical protein
MDRIVSRGRNLSPGEFVYRPLNLARGKEGREDWIISRHEILKKTSDLIYAHVIPWLGKEYDRPGEKVSFEMDRKTFEQFGRARAWLTGTIFYSSKGAAQAAIPQRVPLQPAQLAYFGLSEGATLRDLEEAYLRLSGIIYPANGVPGEACFQLEDSYLKARRSFGNSNTFRCYQGIVHVVLSS